MTTSMTAGARRLRILAGLAVTGLGCAQVALAAPVTVTFAGTVFSASGDFAGVTGAVSGSFTYDSVPGSDLNGNPLIGLYVFSGVPYGFSASINGFGTLAATGILAQTSDDGSALPNFDTFQVAGTDGAYQARIDWTGPMTSFTGTGIPDISVLSEMNRIFVIRNTGSGQQELLASLSSVSFATAVPVPATAWLLVSGVALLGGLRRMERTEADGHR